MRRLKGTWMIDLFLGKIFMMQTRKGRVWLVMHMDIMMRAGMILGVDVQNDNIAENDANKIYSKDSYLSMHSLDYGDSSCNDADDLRSSETPTYTTDLENPIIGLGKKFKDIQELGFYLRQYSIK